MGKQYRNEDVGYDLFESVRATNLTYEVTVSHGSQSWTKKVDGMTNMFGPVDKDAKASDVHVFVKVVNVMFSGTGPIENKIREILKSQTTASNTTSNRAVPDNANKSPGQVSTGQDQAGSNTPSITKERPASDVLPGGQGDYNGNIESSPNNRKHDIGKGEDGKSYRKDKNGDYIEISSDEYQSLKSANAQMASRTTNPGAGPVQNAPTSPTIGMPENTSGNDPLANYNYSNSSNSSAAVQIMNSAAPLINQWANQMQANREREEQAEANRLEIIAQVEREEAKKRAEKGQLAASRKALLEKFPDGKTPLSYQVKDASKVYFFTYSYKASSLEGSAPELFISNVFPVAKYGDGSWPFKNNLL